MEYNGYLITQDHTGYAPKHSQFSFCLDCGETFVGSGESIEDCKQQIDELNLDIIHQDAKTMKLLPIPKSAKETLYNSLMESWQKIDWYNDEEKQNHILIAESYGLDELVKYFNETMNE